MKLTAALLGACSALVLTSAALAQTTITIATVNNGDMIRMQRLTDDFTAKNPDIQLQRVTLEENVLRERVTTDIAAKDGQYDVMTIGTYEVPIWTKQDWLLPLDGLDADYDADDILPAIRGGLSLDGQLHAAPLYCESSFIMYRTDLFEEAGIGRAFAAAYARKGARVAIADIDLRRAEEAAREIGDAAYAAPFGMAPIARISRESHDRLFAVNVAGTLFTMQAVARSMIAQGRRGKIINMAVFLATSEADYIVAQTCNVDGGNRMS